MSLEIQKTVQTTTNVEFIHWLDKDSGEQKTTVAITLPKSE